MTWVTPEQSGQERKAVTSLVVGNYLVTHFGFVITFKAHTLDLACIIYYAYL